MAISAPRPPDHHSVWTFLSQVPHQVRYVEAGGYHTRVLEAGKATAQPVVLLHGTAASLESFCANIGPLAEHFRVIGVDMAGCGWTSRVDQQMTYGAWSDHVVAVMDALEVDRASFIGVSLGSGVAACLAKNYPGRAHKVIMVAPAAIISDVDKFNATLAEIRKRRGRVATGWNEVRAIFQNLFLKDDQIMDDLVAMRRNVYLDPMIQRTMSFLVVSPDDPGLTWDDWRALEHEIITIAATDAPNLFLDNAYRIAELAPNARAVEMTGCDHWAQFERADAFNDLAIDFFRRMR